MGDVTGLEPRTDEDAHMYVYYHVSGFLVVRVMLAAALTARRARATSRLGQDRPVVYHIDTKYGYKAQHFSQQGRIARRKVI